MTATKPSPVATAILALSLDAIVESADNPRKHFDPAFITELANSLRTSGQFTPCVVRPHPKLAGKYELAAGATRLRAAREAKLERLDCLVRTLADAQFLEVLTFENLKRKDLRPMEEARSYALLQKRIEGWTVEKIAERSGVSAGYVRDRLRLLSLCPEAVELLDANRIQLSHALELAKLTAEQQREIMKADSYDGGLFRDEENISLLPAEKKEKFAGMVAVSARELKAAIADKFPVDLAATDTHDLFPDLATAVTKAEAKALPVVQITDAYNAPDVEKGAPRILDRRQWKRADGSKGAKACKHAVLGAGVHGGIRGQAFAVCTASTECRTHFGQEIQWKEREAESARAGKAKSQKEEPWAKRQRLEREAKARFQPAIAPLKAAIRTAIATASTKLNGPLDKLISRDRPWPKAKDGTIGRGSTPEDLMRYLASKEVAPNEYYAHTELPRIAKLLGVNAAAIIKAAQPKKEKTAPKTATKKKGKGR